jgi:two-component system cell cycle sensor histidine kinase PleC
MLNRSLGSGRSNSLMSEYATLIGDAILNQRTRAAEHAARIESELANKVKSEFLSNMSHELRTPLNTVIGFSKILSEHGGRKLPEAEIIEYSTLIRDAARHLLSVINDILDISKIQSGKYTIDARETSLDDVLNDAITGHRVAAREAQVTIHPRIPLDLPAVRGDSAKLRQAFSNIISNAVKFSHRGGTVTVEGQRLSDDGVRVQIRDKGVGMTENEILVALTPFGQVDGSRSRWREGTGLGLPIAKALIELHGGRLEISSAKDKGTEVTVTLPSRRVVSVAEARDAVLGRGMAL